MAEQERSNPSRPALFPINVVLKILNTALRSGINKMVLEFFPPEKFKSRDILSLRLLRTSERHSDCLCFTLLTRDAGFNGGSMKHPLKVF